MKSKEMSDGEKLLTSESVERKKEEKKSYYIMLLTQPKIILTFYAPRDKVNTLINFFEISDREDKSHSVTAMKAFEEYVQRHHIPNPQAQLDRLMKLGLSHKPKWMCCVPNCKRKAQAQLILANFNGKTETFSVCLNHKTWRHPDYKFLKAYKQNE